MGKVIDISSRLSNVRPKLVLSEDKVYEIDDTKNTVIMMEEKLSKSDMKDVKALNEVFELTLGKKAAEEIDSMNLGISAYQTIFIAIMAGITGEEFEETERRFREFQPTK